MKNIRTTILLVLALLISGAGLAKAQTVNVKLTIMPNPSSHLSDWQSDPNAVIVTVVNPTTQPLNAILSSKLEYNGQLAASIKESAKPQVTLAPGTNIFRGAQILPINGIEFTGNLATTAQRSGMLPEGQYQLCVNFQVTMPGQSPSAPPNTVNAGNCGQFTIVAITPPVLLQPADGASIGTSNQPQFSWLPPSPLQSGQPMQYRLKIVEIIPGQSASDALRINQTTITNSSTATTATIPTTQFTTSVSTSRTAAGTTTLHFAWNVTAMFPNGSELSSAPASFLMELPTGRALSDTDCVKYKIELEKINDALTAKCDDCEKLRLELEKLQQELDLANQEVASANADLDAAKGEEADAQKKADASAKAYTQALNNFTSMAKGAGLTVVTYGPPGGFSSITKDGYATVGGGSGKSGIAVQGSVGAVVAAGNSFGRSKGISKFWSAFNSMNKQAAANQAAQNALAAATAKTQKAQQHADDAAKAVKDLDAKITDLKAKLADCDKEKEALSNDRDAMVGLHTKCLEILARQQDVQRKIGEAEDAVKGAGQAIAGADDGIGKAQDEVNGRPGASGSGVNKAKDENDKARSDSAAAADLVNKAKAALAAGDTAEAARLAEEAKKKAEQAKKEANEAGSDANNTKNQAMQNPTKEEIDAQNKKDTDEKVKQDSIRNAHAQSDEARKIILDRLSNGLQRWGIPDSVTDCLVTNTKAFEAFLKWVKDNKPKNVDATDLEAVSDILENIGEIASAVSEALAKGESIATGLANGLASAGINIGAGFFYKWVEDAGKAAAKRIADTRVKQLIAAQATGNYGVIKGKGVNGESATSYFYFKDCHGILQIFRISATYGFEYLGPA
jgi:hypothetical protein